MRDLLILENLRYRFGKRRTGVDPRVEVGWDNNSQDVAMSDERMYIKVSRYPKMMIDSTIQSDIQNPRE